MPNSGTSPSEAIMVDGERRMRWTSSSLMGVENGLAALFLFDFNGGFGRVFDG